MSHGMSQVCVSLWVLDSQHNAGINAEVLRNHRRCISLFQKGCSGYRKSMRLFERKSENKGILFLVLCRGCVHPSLAFE